MFSLSKRLLLAGVAVLLSTFAVASNQYPDKASSTRTTVTVHIVWLPHFKATNYWCSFLSGSLIPTDGTIVGCYDPSTSTIYAVEPQNFNDLTRLEILGHEFWHALGAMHP